MLPSRLKSTFMHIYGFCVLKVRSWKPMPGAFKMPLFKSTLPCNTAPGTNCSFVFFNFYLTIGEQVYIAYKGVKHFFFGCLQHKGIIRILLSGFHSCDITQRCVTQKVDVEIAF